MSTTITAPIHEMTENIYRVRLPLPFALNHVNCYLLCDEDGWTLVDAGLHQPACVQGWAAAWSSLGVRPQDVRRIVLTHMHPDHYGLSGWLQRASGAPVFLSPRERELAELTWVHDEPTEMRRQAVFDYLYKAGITPDVASVIGQQQDRLRSLTTPQPTEVCTLEAGTVLEMGGRRFEAIHAPGHADAQLIFYAAADRLLLCGDQVLNKITPNIGVWPISAVESAGGLSAVIAGAGQPGRRHGAAWASRSDHRLASADRRTAQTP